MSFLFTITDVLLLFFLWKAFRREDRSFYFNPYLATADDLLDKALAYAEPIMPGAGRRLVAAIVFLFLLVFRNLLFPDLAVAPVADFGGGMTFPSLLGRTPRLAAAMVTGTVRFLQFLFSVWGAFLLVKVLSERSSRPRIFQAYEELTVPFSRLSPVQMLLALFLLHGLLALALAVFCPHLHHGGADGVAGQALAVPHGHPAGMLATSLWLGALATVSSSLLFTQRLLMFFIFASLFALILQRREMALFCQEAMNLLLGRFARRPLTLGTFDFTPILFYMGLSFAYYLLTSALFLLRPYLLSPPL